MKLLKNLIIEIKLLVKKITGNYITKKIRGNEKEYLDLYNNCLNKQKNNDFINKNFDNDEIEFVNKLSLKTQIVKKSSELNFIHGFYIFYYLKKYVEKNNVKNISILETGTARGFSSVIMSYLLHSKKISYKIYTIDVIPNNKKIYWNCITDLRYGKITRKELLKNYHHLLQNIIFLCGTSRKILKQLSIERINFSFLDSSHDYDDVKFEFDYIEKNIKTGDIVFFDDYTPSLFPGIVRLVKEIQTMDGYNVTIISSNHHRGYAICEKK
ncbi:class I SAM-dependent methyltransferase [Candidatus Pelagibacter ubique]|nr:class I SAM-dependent methyltransferase [Candidatus Pelagibacter ubique]